MENLTGGLITWQGTVAGVLVRTDIKRSEVEIGLTFQGNIVFYHEMPKPCLGHLASWTACHKIVCFSPLFASKEFHQVLLQYTRMQVQSRSMPTILRSGYFVISALQLITN